MHGSATDWCQHFADIQTAQTVVSHVHQHCNLELDELQCFGENLKCMYFGSYIWTLLCSLFVVVLTIVVLAVIYLVTYR